MYNSEIKTGIVESIDDPTCTGRIKVRVAGIHDGITTEELPWCNYGASPVSSGNGGGQISVPKVGMTVRVRYRDDEPTSMEWFGANTIDSNLINEIKSDYQGTHVLLYDSGSDVAVMYQNGSGIRLYNKGSYIQLSPDNNITIKYADGGPTVQLSAEKIDIQAPQQINLTTQGSINIEAPNITIGNTNTSSVLIKGQANTPAVDGNTLLTLLQGLAEKIDMKMPQTPETTVTAVNATKDSLLDKTIRYFK